MRSELAVITIRGTAHLQRKRRLHPLWTTGTGSTIGSKCDA